MSEQLSFDAGEANVRAQTGMDQALSAQRALRWRITASWWLDHLAPDTEFTADDLVADIGLPDEGKDRNNSVGAWMSAQAKEGRLIFTGKYRKSERVIRHGNIQRVWRKR